MHDVSIWHELMFTEYKVSFGNDINCSIDAITVATKKVAEKLLKVEHCLQLQKEFQWTVLQTRAFQII